MGIGYVTTGYLPILRQKGWLMKIEAFVQHEDISKYIADWSDHLSLLHKLTCAASPIIKFTAGWLMLLWAWLLYERNIVMQAGCWRWLTAKHVHTRPVQHAHIRLRPISNCTWRHEGADDIRTPCMGELLVCFFLNTCMDVWEPRPRLLLLKKLLGTKTLRRK